MNDASPSWRRYLRFWGADHRRDLDDELAFHLEARYDEYLALGMDPVRARAEATARFGDVMRFRDQCEAIDSQWEHRRSMTERLHTIAADLRYATRQLLRAPSLTIAAVLCFALGIGANTSIFSVVDAVLLRPLPFPASDRLVLIGEELPAFGGGNTGAISAAEFVDYQTLNGRVFAGSAIFDNTNYVLSGDGEPERLRGAMASAALFDVLGVKAAHGRAFLPGEDRVGGANVAVLSDALWRRRFSADPSIVGRSVRLDGQSYTVVGVMPAGFVFPLPGTGDDAADLFTPYRIDASVERERGNSYGTRLLARLAPNISVEQATSAAMDVTRSLRQRHPEAYGPRHTTLAAALPLRERAVGSVRQSLLVLLATVGLVLLIACINVSSLLLARATARRRELSVRRALGASRGRLVQQFLAESFVLVALGAALGAAFSVWGARALVAYAPDNVLQGYHVGVDARVLAFTAAVAVVTAVVVSLFPALQQREGGLAATLREDGRTAGAGGARQRGRRSLVISEIALAMMVATGAGLMVKSFLRARNGDPGFNPERVATFRLGLLPYRYPTGQAVLQFETDMARRLATLPGVKAASAASSIPTSGAWDIAVSIEGSTLEKTPIAFNTLVFPDYFATMQLAMRAGVPLTGRETRDAPRVAVINETFARKYFHDVDPVGKRIKWGSPTSPTPFSTIVGVARDVKVTALDAEVGPAVYFPALQQDSAFADRAMRNAYYIVRTDSDPATLFSPIREAVRAVDPDLPIVDLSPLAETMQASVAGRRFNTTLLAGFAGLALLLAAIGIYGLMSYAVVQRTRELGIRLAIGARPRDVVALVVRQGGRLALIGVAIGVLGSLALTRPVRTLLFEVDPLDPMVFAIGTVGLFLVAAVASYLPARRAARIDPQSAIRGD